MDDVNDYAVTIPSDLEDEFLAPFDGRLKTKWVFRCMDRGYGVVRVRRVSEEYEDWRGVIRRRVSGHQLVFTSVEVAIEFKLRYL